MARVSADQVFELVSGNKLTVEQRAIVEQSSLQEPTLVIAGAGSGKTELMMVRILYLVANSFARPDQILGLTFTKKAAAELSSRVQQGLIKLRESSLWPQDLEEDFLPAKIVTYNSFGNEIFRSLALEIGFESDAKLITDAASTALAKELLDSASLSDYPGLEHWQLTGGSLLTAVLKAAGLLTDHRVQAQSVQDYLDEFSNHLASIPKNEKQDGRFSYTQDFLDDAAKNKLIFELAQRYRDLKRERNVVDFSDQVALALEALERVDFELDYRFVMLDEYQDTSNIQTELLARLFAGRPVMAVGDPNQAIYGWRGASSENLANFHLDFGGSETFALSASWRSGAKILDAANHIASEIPQTGLTPISLTSGLGHESQVEVSIFQDELTEVEAVANYLASEVDAETSCAILFRTRASMKLYSTKLSELGVTHEVTGLSGLIEEPEVADLIAILKVLVQPEAGAELLRIAAGPKFRIAPSDLVALAESARRLSSIRTEVDQSKPVTIVELIDEIEKPSNKGKLGLSAEGEARLTRLAKILANLRRQLALAPSEIAQLAISQFELDIELFAHSDAENPLANLQAFLARITEFESMAETLSLSTFVSWLDLAKDQERFEVPRSGSKKGVVQLMTIHAAKGLEWDVVVLPQFTEGTFPTGAKGLAGELEAGELPTILRQDRGSLPPVEFKKAATQNEFKRQNDAYREQNRERQLIEERRLCYVAITRAAKKLLITASHFSRSAAKQKELSRFLLELLERELVQAEIPEVGERPEFPELQISWPFDPLGNRREGWEQAASLVSTAPPASIDKVAELALLLEERERSGEILAQLPLRLSASSVVALLADAAKFAASLIRPVPSEYSEAAALGTSFHASLESAFLAGSELDLASWEETERKLGVSFLESRFAKLTPELVETPIEFSLGGTVVVCKLDAVYKLDDMWHVVDWKSGKIPSSKQEIAEKAVQLALYRIALSRHKKIPVERIQASFFYAASGEELMPELPSEKEIGDRLAEFRKVRRG